MSDNILAGVIVAALFAGIVIALGWFLGCAPDTAGHCHFHLMMG